MILKNQGISDETALKLVFKVLKRNQSIKGFKVNTKKGEKTITFDELLKFVEDLANSLSEGSYGEIRHCNTCGNFSRSGTKGQRGWCCPDTHTSFRNNKDYCSGWKPMTEEQKHIKEVLDEHFKTL